MKTIKGIFRDSLENDTPEGCVRFAKNLLSTNIKGILENEPGFSYLSDVPGTVIGGVVIDNTAVLFSTDNTTCDDSGMSTISTVDLKTGQYNKILDSTDVSGLNFCTEYPIEAVYETLANGDRVVAFIEDNNPPRLVNIDDPQIDDINDLLLFPLSLIPIVENFQVEDSGGSLKTGCYFVFFKYRNNDGTETNWFNSNGPYYINDEISSRNYEDIDGCDSGINTSKQIRFELTHLDTSYDKLVMGVMHLNQGSFEAYEVKQINVTDNLIITLSGGETTIPLSIDEILVKTPSYISAKAITTLNNNLYLGNLTTREDFKLQSIASDIKVNYTYQILEPVSFDASQKNQSNPRGFHSEEVYALYIGFYFNDGNISKAYHIPGRVSVPEDLELETIDEIRGAPINERRFRLYPTSDMPGAASNLGYWENQDEMYPDNEENNARIYPTGKVRHHRMPSLKRFIDRLESEGNQDAQFIGINKLPVFGLEVSNVNIPDELKSEIQGWQIFYAKKTITNSLVLGQDILQYPAHPEGETDIMWSSAGNWHLEGEQAGGGDWGDMGLRPAYLRGHCLDLMSTRAAVQPGFISLQYKLGVTELDTSEFSSANRHTSFRDGRGLIERSGDDWGNTASVISDFTVPNIATRSDITTRDYNVIYKIEDWKYLPGNSQSDYVHTLYTEPIISARFFTQGSPIPFGPPVDDGAGNIDTFRTNSPSTDHDHPQIIKEFTWLYNYITLLDNPHESFLGNHQLVATDKIQTNLDDPLTDIYNGDGFVSYQSFITASPIEGFRGSEYNTFRSGLRCIKGFIAESKRNWNYRHQEDSQLYTQYYPKTDPDFWWDPEPTDSGPSASLLHTNNQLNQILYNTDFNYLNEVSFIDVYDPDIKITSEFPTLVIKSASQSNESSNISWKTFRANDRYVGELSKGEIVNLTSLANEHLIIHQRDGLFITRDRTTLEGDTTKITLGSGDIFALNPKELVSIEEGYAGTQHKFSCRVTKAGYFFTDMKRGKIFMLTGTHELHELSKNGLRNFFRDYLEPDLDDNPFIGKGVTVAYDEKYNRILASFLQENTQITVSYSPETSSFVSFHDYHPNFMMASRDNGLFSINNGFDNDLNPDMTYKGIFRHNDEINGKYGVYYNIMEDEADRVPYPMIVDPVYNQPLENNKLFQYLKWITEVRDKSNKFYRNETFDRISIWNNTKATGEIDLHKHTNINQQQNNTRNWESNWMFNLMRNIALQDGPELEDFEGDFKIAVSSLNGSSPWYKKSRFIDKFITCRFIYLNLNDRKIALLKHEANFRPGAV